MKDKDNSGTDLSFKEVHVMIGIQGESHLQSIVRAMAQQTQLAMKYITLASELSDKQCPELLRKYKLGIPK